MAAPICEDIAEMIRTALTEFEQRVGPHMQAMQAEHMSADQARASLAELANGTRQEFVNSHARIESFITSNNTTFDEHKAALQKVVDDFQQAGVDGSRIAMALGSKEAYAIELKTWIETQIRRCERTSRRTPSS